MKKEFLRIFVSVVITLFITTGFCFAASGDNSKKEQAQYVEGELLVKFKSKVPDHAKSDLHNKHGSKKIKEFPGLRIHHVKLKKGLSVEGAIEQYLRNPNVEYAEPNYLMSLPGVPNDPFFDEQWGLQNIGQTYGTPDADIDATEAWDVTTGDSTVVVAVIDSGVDYTHEDLAANMWVNSHEIPGNGIDDDGNGYADDIHGIDTFYNDSDPMDVDGHGTHIAGIIGAVGNNGVGIAGVNWNLKIMACRFIYSTYVPVDRAIQCLEYVRTMKDNGVNIVATNNSYGGNSDSRALYDAINAQRDILYVAAAGNEHMNNDGYPYYPASYDLPHIIAVAATDYHDNHAYFSNYGSRSVHVGAPGSGIYSTLPGNSYASWNGTSMAAPHVTGLAALLKAQDPGRDWRKIKNLILSGGDSVLSLSDKTITGKRINALGSLACIDSPVFSILDYTSALEIGETGTLSILSINCDSAVGPVTAATSSGDALALYDNGTSPDLQAGDGIFSATWTPLSETYHMTVASPDSSVTLPAYVYANPVQWIQTYGGNGNDQARDITVDANGNSYVTGIHHNGMNTDYLTIKYSADGTVLWTSTYDSGNFEGAEGIAVDDNGNVYVTGYSYSSAQDIVYLTIKYDANGIEQWVRPYSRFQYDYGQDVAVDPFGNVYVTGYSSDGVTGLHDDMTLKYDAAGNLIWQQSFTQNSSHVFAKGIAADASGDVYVVGYFLNYSVYHYFTVKYSSLGETLWSRTYSTWKSDSSSTSDTAQGVALDPTGNVYVTGNSFGDSLTLKYDSQGNVLWAREYPMGTGSSRESKAGIAVDELGRIYVTGHKIRSDYDYFTIIYDSSGNLIWVRAYDRGPIEYSTGVAVDGSGQIYVTGYSSFDGVDYDYVTIRHEITLHIASVSLPFGVAGMQYSEQLSALGGLPPSTWSVISGVLPNGLTLESGTGTISGVPLESGAFDITVQVTDATANTATQPLSLIVYEPLTVTTSSLPYATVGIPYSQVLTATGGRGPYAWSMNWGGNGLALYTYTGELAGTPTRSGSATFTVEVTDANGLTGTQVLSIRIYGPLEITTTSLPYGIAGASYSTQFTASGGLLPYTWSIIFGSLPDGLTLNPSSGQIAGTPTTGGTYDFTVQLSDTNGTTTTKPFSLLIYDPLVITTATLPSGIIGSPYSHPLAASGGMTPYTWSLVAGALPPGLTLDSTSGQIWGTPSATGIFDFSVQVTDAKSDAATQTLSLRIATTYFIYTASDCGEKIYKSGPRYATFGTTSGDCAVEDTVQWRFSGAEDMLVGYLANGGFSQNVQILGEATGSNLSFLAYDASGTGYVHLVEVNPADGTVIQILSTVTTPLTAGTLTSITDISGLTGTVQAGNTVGIMLSMETASRSINEVKWGKTNGGAGYEQWFTVTEADAPCVPTGLPDSTCDGIDDDCDGTADDSYVPTPTSCGDGICASTGQLECQNGIEVDTCIPGTPQTEGPEGDPTCSDTADNDCDTLTDGNDPDCQGGCTPVPEVCTDGIDNDCDGKTDCADKKDCGKDPAC